MHLGQFLGLLVLIISLYILWQIKQVILLVFAAVVLATIMNRIVQRLQKYHLKRGAAIAIAVLGLLILVVGFFAAIVPRLVEQLQQLIVLLPKISTQVQTWIDWALNLVPGRMLDRLQGIDTIAQNLQTLLNQLLNNFFVVLNNSFAAVIGLLLFVVLSVMLLANPAQYRRIFILAFPAFYRKRVDEILTKCEHSLVGWIRGTLIAMLAIGFLSFIGLSVLRVRIPLVNAALAGLLEFIPNVGPTLSIIPPMLLAFLDAPWKAGAVVILYLAIQQFESLVLVPIIMKQTVNLLPVFTILAVIVFASFFGFLGLFLAIPLLIVFQIWLKEVLVKDVLNTWN